LHGRIFRSVEGFMRLLRLAFLDFFPALLTGVFALVAALTKQPWMGVVMVGVIPTSLMLTAWQLVSQKNVRLQLIRSREELDGTVVEQLSGIDYVRVANTHSHEVRRVAKAAEKRRAKEMSHHVAMMFFGAGKALTEGAFHVLVLGLAVYLAAIERISYGDILTFSGLFLGVMTPLAEISATWDSRRFCSPAPSRRTSATAPARACPRTSAGRLGGRASTTRSCACRKATRHPWRSAAAISPAGSGSGWRWRGCSSRTRRS
jgi:ATP-binding cassette subfamily B protein